MNLNNIPFSTFGSSLTIQELSGKLCHGSSYYLRPLYEDDRGRVLFRLSFDGNADGMRCEYSEQELVFSKGDENIHVCMMTGDAIRFYGNSSRFELYMAPEDIIKYNAAMFLDNNHVGINVYTRKAILYANSGEITLDAPWGNNESCQYIRITVYPGAEGTMDFVFQEFRTEFLRNYLTNPFPDGVAQRKILFEQFLGKAGRCKNPEYADAYRTANYLLWNNAIGKNQLIKNAFILSDKDNACEATWFDSVFIAGALMGIDSELAIAQVETFAGEQDVSGALPFSIGSYRINNRMAAAPAEGFIVRMMLERDDGRLTEDQWKNLYSFLAKHVQFWLNRNWRDREGGIGWHHPDEKVIKEELPYCPGSFISSPDLICYVILDLDCLARIAGRFGLEEDVNAWEEKRNIMLGLLLDRYYDYNSRMFTARDIKSGESISAGMLEGFLPVALGDMLPRDTWETLVKKMPVEGLYRFPQWTLFFIDGLYRTGHGKEAAGIARSCCDVLAANSFHEYCAGDEGETGKKAFSASAAVFIILLKYYLMEVAA